MSSLTQRIKSYLDAHASQWMPAPLLYSLASSKGYSHDEIKRALSEVSHTPPYATWSVSAGDYRAEKEPGVTGKGVYYRSWAEKITPQELKKIKDGLEYFDSMP